MNTVDISSAWGFVRGLLVQIYGVFTDDFLKYGTLQFSIGDVLIGFLVFGIFLRLVYARMHIADVGGAVDKSGVHSAHKNATPRVNVNTNTVYVGNYTSHKHWHKK